MTPADITALRALACKVIAELGMALATITDVEVLLSDADVPPPLREAYALVNTTPLIRERMDTACSALESTADHLADLVTAADQLALKLAPQGEQP